MATDGQASLLYLIKRVELAVRKHLDVALEAHGVTTVQYTALTVLERHPEMTAAALARFTFVTAQTIAQLVRTLVERGWVDRHPDPGSRRQHLLSLTADGQRLLHELRAPVSEVEQRMTAGFDASELATVRDAMRSFRAALEP